MGGASAKPETGERTDVSRDQSVNSGRPYYFLASCPDDLLEEAIALADRYGGFHCVGNDCENFDAWKGKVEGQFLTLKRLSPAGRKVVAIAIAGFGHCNDEREFLVQLRKKKDHEQFVLKQCGDAADMKRWLRSEGYKPVDGSAFGSALASYQSDKSCDPEDTSGTQPITASERLSPGLWESMHSMLAGTDPAAARRERSLMDLQRAVVESNEVDDSHLEELQIANMKLGTAIQHAVAAGVPRRELQLAEARVVQLQKSIVLAQRRRSLTCCGRWCCCKEALEWKDASSREEARAGLMSTKGETTLVENEFNGKIKSPEQEIRQREMNLQQQPNAMRTMLPGSMTSRRLQPGTRCRYNSARNGWMSAVVKSFNMSDSTYDLDVRPHAKLENIFPAGDVPASKAWPAGTLVEYESSTAGTWLSATIRSYSEGVRGGLGTYNLDVRERAAVDRIRLRLA